MYKLPQNLVLDYDKWRCGADSKEKENKLGKGHTYLLNRGGFECCLGQFGEQCGVPRKLLRGRSYPSSIQNTIIQGLSRKHTDKFLFDESYTRQDDTSFAKSAVEINDDTDTTVATKVVKLAKLCKKYGRTLRLKNFPPNILREVRKIKSA